MGEVTVVDCLQVGIKNSQGEWEPWGCEANFLWKEENLAKHGISDRKVVQKYKKLYAWVFDDVTLYEAPKPCKDLFGCRVWIVLKAETEAETLPQSWPLEADQALFAPAAGFVAEEGVLAAAGHVDELPWLASWDGAECVSANTLGDGACGLHAVFGERCGSCLKWSDSNGRKRVADALRNVVESHNSAQAEAVQVALWHELAVPGACGKGAVESQIFWRHLLAMCPVLCDAIQEILEKNAASEKDREAEQLKLIAACREVFLTGSQEGMVESLCAALGFGQEERAELCYEVRQEGEWVKGSGARRPQVANRPETKWEAVRDPDAAYDALRTAVFLNQRDWAPVFQTLEACAAPACRKIADALRSLHAETRVLVPPAGFATEALPAYMAAVQEAGYYFSADELVAVAQSWGKSLAVVQATEDGHVVPCATTTGVDTAGVVVLVKGGRNKGRLRSHYERLARKKDLEMREGHNMSEVASREMPTSTASKVPPQATGPEAPSFGSQEDGTLQFERAVEQVLVAFAHGEDVSKVLLELPAYSAETNMSSFEEITQQLSPLVAAYEADSITAQDAVRLQHPLWRSTFFPLAVLVEAWSRTTGMPAVFYLDCVTAACMGLLNKDIAVDVAGWECRSRFWAVGTAQPGSGKSPAVDAIVKCLAAVLNKHYDLAPGHKWDRFHLLEAMTHCAALDKLKLTEGYGTIVAGEGAPLLCPSWPTSSTWNQTTHINLARFLDSATGGAVPWETFVDRKNKREAAEEELRPATGSPLERTNVTLVLLQQHSVYLQWWVASEQKNRIGLAQRCLFSFGAAREPGPPSLQLFEQKVVLPILERIFTGILKTLGPKAPLGKNSPGALWRVDAVERQAFYRYRLACIDATRRTRFGESFASGLNKAPYMVSTAALFGTLMESLWPHACAQCLGSRVNECG